MTQDKTGRRALLLGTGCAALALLGACNSASESKRPGGKTKEEDVLTDVASVPVGGGLLTDKGVLVLQTTAGTFTAYDATCPHQQYLVRAPDSAGVMVCSGHGSRFRAADGALIDGPASSNLKRIAVKVSGQNVVRL